jgi:uncharacterized membrane protein YphA (DoxX/SURF4 family)
MIYVVSTEAPLLMTRIALGLFMGISGYHKLTNQKRHNEFVGTLISSGVYSRFNEWAVPTVEFFGGLALFFGLLTQLACIGLLVILATAIVTDCMDRMNQLHPIDEADAVCDLLYLPEVLYAFMLLTILLAGPGHYSLDTFIDWILAVRGGGQ